MTKEQKNQTSSLSRFERKGIIQGNYQTLFVVKGSDLLPYRQSIVPRLNKLWTSALKRDSNDELVIKDSTTYPFSEKHRVFLVQDNTNKDVVAIYTHRKEIVENISILKIGICLVHSNFQGKGIIGKLIEQSIKDLDTNILSFHTQNQHMVRAVRKFCPPGNLFPVDGNIPNEIKEIGVKMAKYPERFDADHMIERKFYLEGNPLYGDRKEIVNKSKTISNFFETNVDFQNGDSLLVIGLIR